MSSDPPIPGACANCATPLRGSYCHQCGQAAHARHDSMRGFIAEGLSDVAQLDSRALLTLRHLLLAPGRMTLDYVSGRRQRYLNPVQLYLLVAALFFLVNAFNPFVRIDMQRGEVRSSLGPAQLGQTLGDPEYARIEESGVSVDVFEERFRTTVSNQLPAFLVAVVIGFALALGVMHPRSQRNLLVHTVFALHFTSFYLLIMVLERSFGGAPGQSGLIKLMSMIGLVYLVVALRRAYAQSWTVAALKGLGLFIAFNALVVLWIAAVTLTAFYTL